MLADDDLLPLSGLQHLLFCERQCALIHIEGIWVEPASAASVAGLRKAAMQNPHAFTNKAIVCVLTGHGLKDPTTVTDHAPVPLEIPAELSALQQAING